MIDILDDVAIVDAKPATIGAMAVPWCSLCSGMGNYYNPFLERVVVCECVAAQHPLALRATINCPVCGGTGEILDLEGFRVPCQCTYDPDLPDPDDDGWKAQIETERSVRAMQYHVR